LEILNELSSRFPKLELLDSNVKHHDLIKGGIDVVLTCYGTIGCEYPMFGIPVINACSANPHCRYDFNINPSNLEEFEEIILNLDKNIDQYKASINKSKILEYYYMQFCKRPDDWLFENCSQFIEDLGSYHAQFDDYAYKKFLDELSPARHEQIIRNITTFVDSNEYRLSTDHFKKV
jgi:hypothetical protein